MHPQSQANTPRPSSLRVRRRPRRAPLLFIPSVLPLSQSRVNLYPPLLSSSSLCAATTTTATAAAQRVSVSLPPPLGVSLSETRRLDGASSVVVTSVRPDGPAHGLVHVGDIVASAADISSPSLSAVVSIIRQTDLHHPITLILERDASPARVSSSTPFPDFDQQISSVGLYAKQDANLSRLIATYVASSRAELPDASSDYNALFKAAIHTVRRRAIRSTKTVQLILSVVYRIKRANIPLTNKFYNVVMSTLIQTYHPMDAVRIFDEIPHPSVECYTTLAKAYAILRRPDDAIALVPLMRNRGVLPNIRTYNSLISSCVRGGNLTKARTLFTEMLVDDVRPNTVSWNIIIDWYVRQNSGSKRLGGALEAFADMKASGVSPNIVTFTTLMKAYTKSGMLNKAEEVFSEMKRAMPVQIDNGVYNTLLSAYAHRLDWRRCVELLEELEGDAKADDLHEDTTVGYPFGDNGAVPRNSQSFSRRRPWLSTGQSREGVSGSQRTESSEMAQRCVSYCLTIKACAGAGRADEGRRVFDRMMKQGFYPPSNPAVVSLLGGYAKTGRLGDCFEMLKSLKTWGVVPETRMLSTVMHGCLTGGRAELALSVYATMKAEGMRADVVTGTLLAKAYGMMGETEKMFNVVKGMEKRSGKERPSMVTYNTLVEWSVRKGRLTDGLRALDFALAGHKRGVRVQRQTLEAAVGPVVASAVGGDVEEVDGVDDAERLEYMERVLEKVRAGGAVANGTVYRGLLSLSVRCKRWEQGLRYMQEREDGLFLVGRQDSMAVRSTEQKLRRRKRDDGAE